MRFPITHGDPLMLVTPIPAHASMRSQTRPHAVGDFGVQRSARGQAARVSPTFGWNPFSSGTNPPPKDAGGFVRNLVTDFLWVGAANLLMPVAMPIFIGLTLSGMLVARRLGLKYDAKQKKFTHTAAEKQAILRKIDQVESRVIKLGQLPARVMPKSWRGKVQDKVAWAVKSLRQYAMNNESFKAFFKVPKGLFAKLRHIGRSSVTLMGLILKNRLSRGPIGRLVTFVLSLTMLKEAADLLRKPSGGGDSSSGTTTRKGFAGMLANFWDRLRGKSNTD